MLQLWKRAIPFDVEISKHTRICHVHFHDSDILKTVNKVVNGKKTEVASRWRLKSTAIPITFPNCPAYYSKRLPPKRLSERMESRVTTKKSETQMQERNNEGSLQMGNMPVILLVVQPTHTDNSIELVGSEVTQLQMPGPNWQKKGGEPIDGVSVYILYELEVETNGEQAAIRKSITINFQSRKLEFKVRNSRCDYEADQFQNVRHLQQIIDNFHETELCPGIKDEKFHAIRHIPMNSGMFTFGVWRAVKIIHVHPSAPIVEDSNAMFCKKVEKAEASEINEVAVNLFGYPSSHYTNVVSPVFQNIKDIKELLQLASASAKVECTTAFEENVPSVDETEPELPSSDDSDGQTVRRLRHVNTTPRVPCYKMLLRSSNTLANWDT
ncbi:hypothetical protein GHT06_022830 [Daphnia sinensis]|uniref:THAP-type domain-containing protein n=1 Tax=Daphnia sinensis TaxID=1820382 RepID=A0AAD5PPW2_9CRUS|nr:hypothetical protein GHT06_022830 [Daphnia sinensis]